MNRERFKLFIDALRSGKYQKTRDVLSQNDKYCATGVLCDVALKNEYGLGKWIIRQPFNILETKSGVSESRPTEDICDWYGISNDGWVGQYDLIQGIIDANDNGDDFAEIADWLEGLFNEYE